MKILFHIPTETLKPYPREDEEPVVGLDPEYDTFDLIQKPQPEFDPSTHWIEGTETIDVPAKTVTRGWQINALPDFKVWDNVQNFMTEFSMPEKAAIALSIDSTIAALRLELSTWLSEVHSNDPRVVTGLDRLVELEIINETRRTEIITKD
jgi:hypothetical protein